MKFIIAGKEVEVPDTELTAALEAKAESIDVTTDLVVRDKAEQTTFEANIRKEAKAAGVEMAVKEAREKLGLEFTGKTVDNLLAAHETKVLADAKIEPEKKLQEATEKIKTLAGTIETLTGEKEKTVKEFSNFKSQLTIENSIRAALPEKLLLPADDMVMLLKNKITMEVNEAGKTIVKDQNGEIIRNPQTADPKELKDVLGDFFRDNKQYVAGPQGGGGGGDSKGGGTGDKKPLSLWIEEKVEAGIFINSPEMAAEMEKDKASIDMDK